MEQQMPLTRAEIDYLEVQQLGRLATIQPDGSPQVKPVGFRYNPELATIDIGGFRMSASQKFRNVSRDGRAALVVDDIASTQPWRGRFLESRGGAEAPPAVARGEDPGGPGRIPNHPPPGPRFGGGEAPGGPPQHPPQ